MRNAAVVVVLGFALVISISSALSADNYIAVSTVNQISVDNLTGTVETTAAPKAEFVEKNSASELFYGYKKPTVRFGKTIINVPIVNQYPELPVGCEITSATAYLNYLGIDVDKVELQDGYLPDSYNFVYFNDGRMRTGPDPSKVFVGLPEESGFGCYDTVIVDTLNRFFADRNYNYEAIKLDGATQADLEELLDNGIPIEVWASIDMIPFKYIDANRWVLETTGEEFCWPKNSHALVLCGYDEKNYYFSDCNDKTEIVSYRKRDFLDRWEEFGNQAVIIKILKENE